MQHSLPLPAGWEGSDTHCSHCAPGHCSTGDAHVSDSPWGSDCSPRLGKYWPEPGTPLCTAQGQREWVLVPWGRQEAQDDAHGVPPTEGAGPQDCAEAVLGTGKGRSCFGSSRGDGEGSVNQTQLTRGWRDYRVPGKLLTNTSSTKQPSRAEG